MTDFTPPTGGHLLHTLEPNPGDRIADALAALRRTPPPGWMWALWAPAVGPTSPLLPPMPADVEIVRMGEGVGFDTSPPHYGIINREHLRPYGENGPTSPEVFGGLLVRMFAAGRAPDGCTCGACVETGIPPGLMEYACLEWLPGFPDPIMGRDYSHIRFSIALEIAAARAMRANYIHALRTGGFPAEWLEEATDPDYPGHYLARMSDTGLAAGICSVWWWEEMLEAGLPFLFPVEMLAALAQGFSYPVPSPGTPEWRRQAAAEERMDAFPNGALLNNTAADLAEIAADGIRPWDGGHHE